jgi:hypothetical protein
MPISHFSKLFAVEDAKIAQMTADPSGGSATYGSLIDVPGIKEVQVSGTVESKELRGDNALLDARSVFKSLSITVSHAKMSLDVLPVLLGGTTADSGTTPNMKATFDLLGADTPNYFKFEAKTPADGADTIGGDVHITLHKCVVSGLPDIGFAEEDYRTVGFSAVCSPLLATANKWLTIVFNETAAAIA